MTLTYSPSTNVCQRRQLVTSDGNKDFDQQFFSRIWTTTTHTTVLLSITYSLYFTAEQLRHDKINLSRLLWRLEKSAADANRDVPESYNSIRDSPWTKSEERVQVQ
ncbi:hypothetical protein GYMLUDRAFT_927942 [Collybiopsis luxurians FD-317 M1]|nr:hypothetical protein GYMLUDRAFT_927942 [Collybiopsis luxurians FD-317 M1]